MSYKHIVAQQQYVFPDLKTLMAKATPLRSGDELAGIAAHDATERVAAQITLADVPLKNFLNEALIDYDADEITRLILDEHHTDLFIPISHFTVGDFRNWLLSADATTEKLQNLALGLTPEMVAAVSKIMRNQDLIYVANKCEVITQFRNTIGLKGHLSTRLQPNHPTDDLLGISASILDGLMYGNGDAVIGINPATDNLHNLAELLKLLDYVIQKYQIPTQSCVLTHISSGIQLANQGIPIDLMFQSIAGTQKANEGFGISLALLQEGYEATLALKRGTIGQNVMYFETGQGSALSSQAHHGVDQQTVEARAYAVARKFNPLLVNTVVGFIGPEYLYDGKQIIRAGLEDHFCGKLLGLPMGCDICYTNHAEADQNDMDVLLTLFGTAGLNFMMGIPGSDDVMLNYQTTSFHDALYLRQLLGLKPAPEFLSWLEQQGIMKQEQQHIHWPASMPTQFLNLLH
jgi:ethanolamine ammonia-lyase large subunit